MTIDDLLPGHILVHHDRAWYDTIMEFGERMADGSSPLADNQATHIDTVMTGGALGFIAKMNPPSSTLYQTDSLDFDRITVLALKPIMQSDGSAIDPHTDPEFWACMVSACKANLGQPYDWSQILRFAGIGIEGMVDEQAAIHRLQAQDREVLRKGHFGVCSVWTERVLEAALQARFGTPFNIARGSELAGRYDFEPADWQASPMVYVLKEAVL